MTREPPLRIADTLFRVGQESIANSVRHSNPTVLRIRLHYGENAATLQVEDNGSGFVPGELVTFQVIHADGTAEGGAGHEPWSAYADPIGGITTTW